MKKVTRTRIAPSPTGKFNIATARTALFNYLFAKKNNGDFILRFEDTDRKRSTIESEEDIRDGLKWLGLSWDEEYKQMNRLDIYKKYADDLIDKGFAYKKEGAVWFKIPKDEVIEFEDAIKGKIKFDLREFNDFVIVRSDGVPTFYLTNTVDDLDNKITHSIRGEDHLTNTPKQILIFKALGVNPPIYAHFPMMLDTDKTKLSKRRGAFSIQDFQKLGYLKEAIINFIALMGWNPGDNREYFTLEELIKEFSLEKAQKSPAIWDNVKLDSINSHYIKQLPTEELKKKIADISDIVQKMDYELFEKSLEITKDRLKYLKEFDEIADFFIKLPEYDPKILVFKKSDKEKTIKGLKLAIDSLEKINEEWSGIEKLNEVLADVVGKNNLTNGDVFWPIRVALSGLEKSPSPTELLWAFGKEESLDRLEKALEKLK